MEGEQAFSPWVRRTTAAVLAAGAVATGFAFFAQFDTVFSGRVEDILMGPSLDEGLQKRQKWVRLVRAAAAMNVHCGAVRERAQAAIAEVRQAGARRRSRAARNALRTRLTRLAGDVRPCESAELFLKLAGKDDAFPHVAGLYRYFTDAARLLADARAPRAEEARNLDQLLVAWLQPVSTDIETPLRSVLGVVVRGPTWYVETDAKLIFRGSTAEAWEWLSASRVPARR